MSCYGCTKEYGFFNREHACAKCGMGFCSDCVRYRAVVPGKGNKEAKVCGGCFNAIRNPQQMARNYAPPEALQKRLDALESPGGPPVIVYTENRKMASLRRGMSTDDQKILDRLQKLQQERKENTATPSDSDIRDRLHKLKGEKSSNQPHLPNTGTDFYKPPDKRSEEEKTRHLLEGVAKEVELEASQPTPEQDIALRLAKLRGMDVEAVKKSMAKPSEPNPNSFLSQLGPKSDKNSASVENLDIDEVAKLMADVGREADLEAKSAILDLEKDRAIKEQLEKLKVRQRSKKNPGQAEENAALDSDEENDPDEEERITKQILEEQALEERLGRIPDMPALPGSSSSSSRPATKTFTADIDERDFEPDELPWCVICNEDAKLRCDGCGSDLYCNRCFREFHVDEDPQDHKTSRYTNKTKYN